MSGGGLVVIRGVGKMHKPTCGHVCGNRFLRSPELGDVPARCCFPVKEPVRDWSAAPAPEDMSDALANVLWALDQMLSALNDGRYRHEPVHVRADLLYLRGETRRAIRQRAAANP